MSVVNRRNALIGWTVMKVAKYKSTTNSKNSKPKRKQEKSKQQKQKGKASSNGNRSTLTKSAIATGAAATVGALVVWRKWSGSGDTETK